MKFLISILLCFFSAGIAAQIVPCKKWKEDILFLQKKLEERHASLYNKISKKDFNAKVAALIQEACNLDEHALIVRMSELVANVQDTHTYLDIREKSKWNFKRLPIKVDLFYDGIFITHAAKNYLPLIGEKIISVNGIEINTVIDKIKGVGYRENEMTEKFSAPGWLIYPEVLKTFGIIKRTDSVKIQTTHHNLMLPSLGEDSVRLTGFLDDKKDIPDYLVKKDSIYWHTYSPEKSAMYVQLNLIREDKTHTFNQLSNDIIKSIDQFHPKKLILDLRWNVGGNSKLANPLIYALMHYGYSVPDGNFFVITGRRTLSAAIVLSDEIKKFTNAIFVGEPTGAAPNQYGENSYRLTLPNSGLSISYASAYFQSAGPFSHDKWIAPRLSIKVRSKDYFTLNDPVLDAIWKFKDSLRIWDMIYTAATTDTAKATTLYNEYKTDSVNEYAETEADLRRVGNKLLAGGKLREAEMIYKLNMNTYPDRATSYISLAQLYQQQGKLNDATVYYSHAKKYLPTDPVLNEYFRHYLTDLVDEELKKLEKK